jgi:hypothetical protein
VKSLNQPSNQNIFFFQDYKDLNLPLCELNVTKEVLSEASIKIKIKTDYFAKFVKIVGDLDRVRLSDNYFDLKPNEEKEVLLSGENLKRDHFEIKIAAINQRKTSDISCGL